MARDEYDPEGLTTTGPWRGSTLANPAQRGKKFYADLVLWVQYGNTGPEDYDVSIPSPLGRGYLKFKEVEINREQYDELLANAGEDE